MVQLENNEQERMWNKAVVAIWGNISARAWSNQGIPAKKKTDLQTQIPTGELLHMKLE